MPKLKKSSKKSSNLTSVTSTISGSSNTSDIKIPIIDMQKNLNKEIKIDYAEERRKIEEEKKREEQLKQQNYLNEISKLEDELKTKLPTPGRKYEEGDYLVQCWKCETLNLVHPSWECIECSNCRTLCQIPQNYNMDNYISLNRNDINKEKVTKKINCIYTLLLCPKCKRNTKVSVFNDKFTCPVCLNEYNILKPDVNPNEKFCDSVDPHSHYYKFKFKKEPEYPPKNCIGINDLYFPDPVLFHSNYPYPINPYSRYDMPYQEIESFKRFTRKYNLFKKLHSDIPETQIEGSENRLALIKGIRELENKLDKALEKKYYYGPVENYSLTQSHLKPKTLSNSQSYINDIIDKKRLEKNKLIENMFFMKK